jgi:alpha-glucosidase
VAGDRHDSDVRPWWWDAVVYQVYIRSFADGDGDGTGDLAGLRSRLGYIRDLGVDAIWVNPWYRSPLNDGGYDVADYRAIDPRYGTMAEAEAFIAEAHDHGLRVLGDLVPNHTSSEHLWFKEALAAGPGSRARERYWFRPGRGPDGAEPPNDWQANFGGPAWERVDDGEWYLHLFDVTQPDLNWADPEVRAEFEDILRFWLDRDIDGFRVDVAHGLAKNPDLPDLGADPPGAGADHPHYDRDELHEIVRGWRAVTDEYDGDRVLVAEAWVAAERLPLYLRPDEYHQAFNFDLLGAAWGAGRFRSTASAALEAAAAAGSVPTWVLSNHDVMRHATRYGLPPEVMWITWALDGPHDALDPELGLGRARAAVLFLLALPGSSYLYQGEELGLPEVWDLDPAVLDDPLWTQSGHTLKGRDGCRVPIPWTTAPPSYGFGAGEPWLPQPDSFAELAAAEQEDDPASTLSLYRTALRLRREHAPHDDQLEWHEAGDAVVSFTRSNGLWCIVNTGAEAIDLPAGQVLVASTDLTDDTTLPGNTAAWLLDPS